MKAILVKDNVLIPLNSGLAWSNKIIKGNVLQGLNPFEFRAGLEHTWRPTWHASLS